MGVLGHPLSYLCPFILSRVQTLTVAKQGRVSWEVREPGTQLSTQGSGLSVFFSIK